MANTNRQRENFTADVKIRDKFLRDLLSPTINSQPSSYTLVLTDASKYIRMGSGSAQTLTVPNNTSVPFETNTEIAVEQSGAGTLTIVADTGVTILCAATLVLNGQYATAALKKLDTNTWILAGRLA